MRAATEHESVTPVFVHTGQHYDYEMSQVFLEELELPEFHYFLNVRSGPHGKQTAALLNEIEKTLQAENPDVVIVLGDTNTSMAGALAAVKLQIPVAHVEAGCRSFDLEMPEEINRLVVDAICSIFFAPSEVAALNLLFEGRPEERVYLLGNTVVDIVDETKEVRRSIKLDHLQLENVDVVVTLHRQENVDSRSRLADLLSALGRIEGRIVFPVHPRTLKKIEQFGLMDQVEGMANVLLTKSLNYLSFMKLLEEARVVITDSGGVQEEAIMVGTPCITARDTTEWPETVWAGGNYLAGVGTEGIVQTCNRMLSERDSSSPPREFKNPFKGNAGPAIIQKLVELWKQETLSLPKPDMSEGKYPVPWLADLKRYEYHILFATLAFDAKGRARVRDEDDVRFKVVRRLKS
jgi:UDP-N-acetylglucosamine 2-epimerase (non-hydrolysing)